MDLGVLAELEAMGLVTLADKGYQGSTHAKAPVPHPSRPIFPAKQEICVIRCQTRGPWPSYLPKVGQLARESKCRTGPRWTHFLLH